MITRIELLRWIKTLPPGTEVWIDEGGLTLRTTGADDAYLEVGGEPLPEGEEPIVH